MMSAASWPSDTGLAAPARQRAVGLCRVSAVPRPGAHAPRRSSSETGSLRIRLPKTPDGLEAVLVNTAGGVACGDHFSIAAEAGRGASLTVATPPRKRSNRSDGPLSRIDVSLAAGPGAALHWLPQETILFDTARLARRYEVDLGARCALFLLSRPSYSAAPRAAR